MNMKKIFFTRKLIKESEEYAASLFKVKFNIDDILLSKEEIITSEIDIEEDHLFRRNWGLFRDRRVDLYKELLTLDGKIKD